MLLELRSLVVLEMIIDSSLLDELKTCVLTVSHVGLMKVNAFFFLCGCLGLKKSSRFVDVIAYDSSFS